MLGFRRYHAIHFCKNGTFDFSFIYIYHSLAQAAKMCPHPPHTHIFEAHTWPPQRCFRFSPYPPRTQCLSPHTPHTCTISAHTHPHQQDGTKSLHKKSLHVICDDKWESCKRCIMSMFIACIIFIFIYMLILHTKVWRLFA